MIFFVYSVVQDHSDINAALFLIKPLLLGIILMIKNSFLSLLFVGSLAAQDQICWTLPSSSSDVGAIDTQCRQDLIICSQERYAEVLKHIGCDNLPEKKVDYQQLSPMEAAMIFQSADITFVAQGEAKIRSKPQAMHYFATHSLIDCVGISIWTPTATYFSHMDFVSFVNGKLGRLLDRVDSSQREKAKVTLVSAYKTQVLSEILKVLQEQNYQDISLDVEDAVMLFDSIDSGLLSSKKICPVSAFGDDLSKLQNKTVGELQGFQKDGYFGVKSLFVHAQTGAILIISPVDKRGKDHYILYKVQKLKESK